MSDSGLDGATSVYAPLFTNAGGGDFTLQSTSPCRNAGTNSPGAAFDDALNPHSCTWPSAVYTLDQDNLGSAWEIGAYASAVAHTTMSGNNGTISYTLIDATAATYDIGLLITGTGNTIENTTIDPGNGIAVLAYEDCTITNTIMEGSVQDIDVLYGKTVTAKNNSLHHSANATTNIGDGTYTDSNSVFAQDPLFVVDGSNFRLTSGSPCRDTGFNTGASTDLDGSVTPMGPAHDIGGYEYTRGGVSKGRSQMGLGLNL